jgi:hypothetical protein
VMMLLLLMMIRQERMTLPLSPVARNKTPTE